LMNTTRVTKKGYLRDITKVTWDALDEGKRKHKGWGHKAKALKKGVQWSYDQILLTERINQSGMCQRPNGGKLCYTTSVRRRHPKTDKWFIDDKHRYTDIHVPKPVWADRFWQKSLPFYAGLFGPGTTVAEDLLLPTERERELRATERAKEVREEAREREYASWYRLEYLKKLARQRKVELSTFTKDGPVAEQDVTLDQHDTHSHGSDGEEL
jgi:hypothetical protein